MFSRLLSILLIIVPCFTFAQVDLNKGLVAYYPFNGNANDASGNGNNAILNNATLTTDYYGNANSAYHFNGVDNYMEIPNSNSLNTGNAISICVWVKPTGFYAGMCHGNSVLMKGDNDLEDGNYFVRFDDAFYTGTNCNGGLPDTIHQTFYGRGTGLSPAQDTPFAQKNIWRSLVYTYDGLHAKLYIDCKLVLDSDIPGLSFTNASDLFFGRLNDSNFPYWFNGTMDEVRIFNRPIDSDEVKAYSFSCADIEPCSNWLKTAGVDPGVQIGNLSVTGNQITVEALFNRTDTFDPALYGGDIVSKHTDPTDVNYLLRPTRGEITTINEFGETVYHATPDVCDIQINKTYHVAMVYDGTTLKFYRNGYLMSQTPCSGNMVQNNWITRFGSTANPNDTNHTDFHGYINEVRIWNVARTQEDIRNYMNQSLPNPAIQTGLLAYYTFDDLINKQSNSQWNGNLLNNALINQTNPECTFIADSCTSKQCNLIVNAGKDLSVCNGSSTQLNASGAITYNWNASSTLSDTTIANPVATPVITTQFIVTGYDSTKTCFNKDTVAVLVNPLPVFKINNDTIICSGSAVQLNAMPGNSYKYHWSPYNYLSDTSISNPVSTPADSIIYFVTASDSNNCRSLDSITINVVPKPTVATLNDTSICLGSTVVLSSTSTNANRFIWSPATGLNNNSTESPQASPDSSTDYTISASNGFCSVQNSVIISVLSLPATSAGNDTTTCGTGAAHLLASGATFYTWSPSTGLSDTSIYNPVASPALTTTYYVTGKNSNGCIKTDSVTIKKQPDPVFNITPADSSICAGQKISLSASGGNVYSWSPAQAVSDSTSPNIYTNPSFSTKYIVHISDSICKVSINLSAAVTVLPSPQVTISKSNDIDCSDLQAKLTATGGVTYNWQPNTDIDDPMSATPVVNPPADTRYTVTVTDSDQCVSRASITVNSTLGNVGFYVPTAFTPNGDGLNDCFGLRYWGTPATFDMMIYDKWGYLVFHSQNISDCWDGTIHGKKQGSGTYVYMITATSICGKGKVFRKGTVVLIR